MSTRNIYLWISRFTTTMSQCRESPWYQVSLKIAGTEILLKFQRLGPTFTRGSRRRCSIKKDIYNIYRNTPVPESLFKLELYLKGDSDTGFSCEFFKILRIAFFTEHLWMVASISQQLLPSYFAIIYSCQLSSSETSLVRKKIHPYISGILQI